MKRPPRLEEPVTQRLKDMASARARVLRRASPSSIHDLRVSTRRLEEILSLLRPWLPRRRSRSLARRSRRMRRSLGPLRNADVLRSLAGDLMREAPDPLRPALREVRRAMAREAAIERRSLDELGLPATKRRGRAVCRRLRPAREAELRKRGVAALSRRLDMLDEAIGAALESRTVKALHAARIVFKKYRYTLEALDSLELIAAGPSIAEARDLQAALGDLHDHDLLAAAIRRHAPRGRRAPLGAFVRAGRKPLLSAAVARLTAFNLPAMRRRLLSGVPGGAAA